MSTFKDRQYAWLGGVEGMYAEQIEAKAEQALAANATYLALTTPTVAQNTVQIRLLTRECNALIRLLLGQFDDTEGT